MQYCLRTGFGESSQLYGGTFDNLIAGYGQGNGMAPPSFSVLSSLVVNVYRRKGHRALLTSAYTTGMFLLTAVMYVENMDLAHWGKSQKVSDKALIQHVQTSTNEYGELAQVTGGIVKQEKYFTCLLTYRFVSVIVRLKKWKHLLYAPAAVTPADGTEVPAHIFIPQSTGDPLLISTLEINEHMETLGFCMHQMGMELSIQSKWRIKDLSGWTSLKQSHYRQWICG